MTASTIPRMATTTSRTVSILLRTSSTIPKAANAIPRTTSAILKTARTIQRTADYTDDFAKDS